MPAPSSNSTPTPQSDATAASTSPGLCWLLEMLACMNPHEAMDVLLRPGGDRRRECKLHVPAGERGLLGVLLDLMREHAKGARDEHNRTCESGSETESETESETALYTLENDIRRVVGTGGRPLAGKVIAARLGRKYSGWIKTCLARLVKAGRLIQGGEGYGIAPDKSDDE